MSHNRNELEQRLRAKAEEAIRQLLANLPDKSELTLTDMERLVGEMGRDIMQETLQEVAQGEQVEPEIVVCTSCQIAMHKRGKRKKRVETLRGEIEIERQYYVCPQCGAGTFPPG